MTTLRGIFPEPKLPPKRNFVLENKRDVKKIEQTQVLDSKGSKRSSHSLKSNTLKKTMPKQNAPTKTTTSKTVQPKTKVAGKSKSPSESETFSRDVSVINSTIKSFRSLGVQTVADSANLENTDYIIHAKPAPTNTSRIRKTTFFKSSTLTPTRTLTNNERPNSNIGSSSSGSSFNDDDEHLRSKPGNLGKMSGDTNSKHLKEPQTKYALDKSLYGSNEKKDKSEKKTNHLPKYLRDMKKNTLPPPLNKEEDANCPEGHVALPESERKETLGVLRARFAELVSELNKLPVRTDTLRIRKRKMELEQELCKLEEGIKVFSRHKVYVKVNV